MKKLILCSLTLFLSCVLYAQGVSVKPRICSLGDSSGTTVYELCNGVKFQGFRSNDGFEEVVKKITSLIGLKPNFILVPCPNIKNCAALNYEDNLRYIVYDKEFMDGIAKSVGTNWTNTMILAHEIGHHLNGHTLKQVSKEESRGEELEADEFAGFIMGKLGATINQAIAAMDGLNHPDCDNEYLSDHPCKEKRVAAIKTGWAKATGKTPIVSAKQKAAQRKTAPLTNQMLKGTWYTELDNERNTDGFMPLTITFSNAGTIHYRFYNPKGDAVIDEFDSKFSFKNGILTEEFSNRPGFKATATIEMLSNKSFVLTIIDNGTEGYQGLKRVYVKITGK